MALYNRLYRSLLTVMILSLLAPLSIFAEEPEEVLPPVPPYAIANVDGVQSTGEWGTPYDFLWVNGDTTNTNNLRGWYELKYDCRPSQRILYILVTQANNSRLLTEGQQQVTINNIPQVESTTGDNNSAPDFAWIQSSYSPPIAFRWEASLPLAPGNYTTFDLRIAIRDSDGVDKIMRTSGGADRVDVSNTACSLAVQLNAFTATPQRDLVLLEWETVSETDNLGFNLYRSTSPDEIGEKLNGELIPSQSPGSGQGASYEFMDDKGVGGTSYYYRLEAVDVHGNTTMHGPVNATYPAQPTAVTMALFNTEAHDPRWAFNLGALALGLAGCAVWRWRYRRRSHT
jgi:hypothetical protein